VHFKNKMLIFERCNVAWENAHRRCRLNIVLAIGGLNGSVSTEVHNSTTALRIKFSAKNPAHRQYAAERYAQCYDDRATDEHCSLTLNFCVKLDDQAGEI